MISHAFALLQINKLYSKAEKSSVRETADAAQVHVWLRDSSEQSQSSCGSHFVPQQERNIQIKKLRMSY